jgi:hypothetical protein
MKAVKSQYLDLSNELSEINNKNDFFKFLPKVLPFLRDFSNEMLTGVLIEEVGNKEFELDNK